MNLPRTFFDLLRPGGLCGVQRACEVQRQPPVAPGRLDLVRVRFRVRVRARIRVRVRVRGT